MTEDPVFLRRTFLTPYTSLSLFPSFLSFFFCHEAEQEAVFLSVTSFDSVEILSVISLPRYGTGFSIGSPFLKKYPNRICTRLGYFLLEC